MKRRRYVWYGLAFGVLLFVFALGSAGAGHGSYLPSMIFGAPLSLVPFLGLFAPPVVWGYFGWLLRNEGSRAVIVISIHTAVVALTLLWGSPAEPGSEQSRYFWQAERIIGSWLWTGIAIYTAGLVAAWLLAIDSARSPLRTQR